MLGGHDAQYLHVLWIAVSVIGVAVIATLAVVYRRAARRHELEEAERILAEDEEIQR